MYQNFTRHHALFWNEPGEIVLLKPSKCTKADGKARLALVLTHQNRWHHRSGGIDNFLVDPPVLPPSIVETKGCVCDEPFSCSTYLVFWFLFDFYP